MTNRRKDLAERIGRAVTQVIEENELLGNRESEVDLAYALHGFAHHLTTEGVYPQVLLPPLREVLARIDAAGDFRRGDGSPWTFGKEFEQYFLSHWAEDVARAERRRQRRLAP